MPGSDRVGLEQLYRQEWDFMRVGNLLRICLNAFQPGFVHRVGGSLFLKGLQACHGKVESRIPQDIANQIHRIKLY